MAIALDRPGAARHDRAALLSQDWEVWTTPARLVVSGDVSIRDAVAVVADLLATVDGAASRFRPDSEVHRIAASGRPDHLLSPMLAWLLRSALRAAADTAGDVDPTVSDCADHGAARLPVRWTDVRLDGRMLSMPPGTLLDLGAIGKAAAADLGAKAVVRSFGGGAMLSLGGDLRVAGEDPAGGWHVLAQDTPAEPGSVVQLLGRRALATSSTLHRRGPAGHHILRPQDGAPASETWRTVTVAAATCRQANTFSTAAIVRGLPGLELLRHTGLPARLVAAGGSVTVLNGWPR
jgi:thiamine biosynthesis lipoprotein